MTRTSKMPRYKEFNSFANCFGEKTDNKFAWNKYLDSKKELYLELGCGKAEVTQAVAKWHPEHNFMGVDLKADRLWRPAKNSLEEGINNAVFVQSNILDIESFIKPNSVSGIWITFPDPFPKKRQIKHRMINRNFLDIYKKVLNKEGSVRFKTDNQKLFFWALELLAEQKDVELMRLSFDLHASELPDELKVVTTYENKFMSKGQPIYFMEFELKS